MWAVERRWTRVPRLAVCSDTGELDLVATTDPDEVRAGDPDTAYAGALRGEVPSDRTLHMTATPKRFRRGEPRWHARRSGLYMTAGYMARHQGGNQGC